MDEENYTPYIGKLLLGWFILIGTVVFTTGQFV
jgi:hypothetical protein